jgi:hypothetical protein
METANFRLFAEIGKRKFVCCKRKMEVCLLQTENESLFAANGNWKFVFPSR